MACSKGGLNLLGGMKRDLASADLTLQYEADFVLASGKCIW